MTPLLRGVGHDAQGTLDVEPPTDLHHPESQDPGGGPSRATLTAAEVDAVGDRAWRAVVLANALCVAGVLLFISVLAPVFPAETRRGTELLPAGIAAVGLMFVAGCLGTRRQIARRLAEATTWLVTARPPTDAERRRTLHLPKTLALVSMPWWCAASVELLVATHVAFDPVGMWLSLAVVLAILHTGVVVCTSAYLMLQSVLRPVTAAALRGPGHTGRLDETEVVGGLRARFAGMWFVGSGLYLMAIAVLVVSLPADGVVTPVLSACIVGLTIGSVLAAAGVRTVVERLELLRGALRSVEQGDLEADVAVDDAGEIGRLQAGFNHMVHGLREKERIRQTFGRLVGPEVAERAISLPERGIEGREVSVVFVDIIGSTALATEIPPEVLARMLDSLFVATFERASENGGSVNRFQGDGALCTFNAPNRLEDHAAAALRTAAALRAELDDLEIAGRAVPTAIGVSTGSVFVGDIGAPDRYEYCVIGDAVNEASRLTDEAKKEPGGVLASAVTVGAAPMEAGAWRPAGERWLRGRREATVVYELVRSPMRGS